MVAHAFTPERAEQMRPGIQDKVSKLLDSLQAGPKPVDLQEAFSLPLAFQVR
jgi:cytochrome P450